MADMKQILFTDALRRVLYLSQILQYNLDTLKETALCPSYLKEDATRVKNAIRNMFGEGESGNDIGKYRHRPCKLEWIEQIVDECQCEDIPVFVKQMGTYLAKQLNFKNDRHGGDINQFPTHLQIRQFPPLK